jgi:hypothetical protein
VKDVKLVRLRFLAWLFERALRFVPCLRSETWPYPRAAEQFDALESQLRDWLAFFEELRREEERCRR